MTRRASQPARAELTLPTIVDPALAAAHGSSYMDLAAFASDIDRVYWLEPENGRLPFGWEVFLTEHYLLDWATAQEDRGQEILDAMCSPLFEETQGEPPLGGQIVFAVYDGIVRGALPDELRDLFVSWPKPPRELLHTLHELRESGPATLQRLAAYCLEATLRPPLAATTQRSLEHICSVALPPEAPSDSPA